MKRRGVLGFLGGAVVAGPSMAKQAVAQGMEAMSLGQASGIVAGADAYFGATEAMQTGELGYGDLPPTDPRHWVQRQLSEFIGQSADELRERRRNTFVQSLDPDLAVNRSFSLSAKISIQRDRNFEANRAAEKRSIMADIKRAMTTWSERDHAQF